MDPPRVSTLCKLSRESERWNKIIGEATLSGRHLCNVEGQDAQDVLRPQVPDGRAHGRCSSALVGRSRLSLIALRLCLGCLRAEYAHTLPPEAERAARLCCPGARTGRW